MKPGQKHYIKLFNLRLLKIKAIRANSYDVYLFFIPLLSIRTSGRKTNINFLFIQKIYEKIKRKHIQKETSRKNKKNRQQIIEKFKKGKVLKIAFLIARDGMWCFDYLYKLFLNNKRFEPIVIITPDLNMGYNDMLSNFDKVSTDLTSRNIPYVIGWDFDKKTPIDFKSVINPDIVIHTDFWKPHITKEFYIENILDRFNFLNEYGYSVMQDELTCNFETNNLVDKYFRPTKIHKKMAKEIMNNKGKNVLVTGSPKLDLILTKTYQPHDPWKVQNKFKKRIIWAPHHQKIAGSDKYYNCNAFWEIYDEMLSLATKYKDKIQIAFRPHPMLKAKIIAEWGIDRVNEYFAQWENLENTQISNGNFIDLFLTSDAMIMDSCSFLAEYSATNKPLFYTRTKTSRLFLNEFGKMLFNNVYDTGENLVSDIENFIQEVVINGNDYKKEQRTQFVQQYFGKINGKTASENIYDEIIKFLEKGEV